MFFIKSFCRIALYMGLYWLAGFAKALAADGPMPASPINADDIVGWYYNAEVGASLVPSLVNSSGYKIVLKPGVRSTMAGGHSFNFMKNKNKTKKNYKKKR